MKFEKIKKIKVKNMMNEKISFYNSGAFGTMLALFIVVIVMLSLTLTVFQGLWQFWMFFPIMGVSIAVFITSVVYMFQKNQ
ncbi:MAG: hypothetical protein GY870_08700 [archaeon]|nr:hypothetical protein [archaeon]